MIMNQSNRHERWRSWRDFNQRNMRMNQLKLKLIKSDFDNYKRSLLWLLKSWIIFHVFFPVDLTSGGGFTERKGGRSDYRTWLSHKTSLWSSASSKQKVNDHFEVLWVMRRWYDFYFFSGDRDNDYDSDDCDFHPLSSHSCVLLFLVIIRRRIVMRGPENAIIIIWGQVVLHHEEERRKF